MIDFFKNISIRKFWWLKLVWNKKRTYLYESGWIKSYKLKKPVDQNGNPIPWLSLPLVDYLDGKDLKNLHVFEYGAGNSTFYFAKKAKSVTSVEHEADWVTYLRSKLPSNCTLEVESLENGNAYAEKAIKGNKKYDIILIDGRNRVDCSNASIKASSDQGIFIYDDSHRNRYKDGMLIFHKNGYKKLEFWGMGPGSIGKKCTTLFYKQNNCLDI